MGLRLTEGVARQRLESLAGQTVESLFARTLPRLARRRLPRPRLPTASPPPPPAASASTPSSPPSLYDRWYDRRPVPKTDAAAKREPDARTSPLKHRGQFEMRAPDELVDRHHALEAEAAGDEAGGVAREGGRVTRDRDDGVEP